MKILVLNCGSSSIKYQVFNMEDETVLAKGAVERIGIEGSFVEHEVVQQDKKTKIEGEISSHQIGVEKVLDILQDEEYGIMQDIKEIKAVGHRVAHGGESFPHSTLLDYEDLAEIEDLSRLAPLHNPHNAAGIRTIWDLLPDMPQVGVFDTSFHQSMPKEAYIYPIPYEFYENMGIRRYGFHGTSHKYVAEQAAQKMGQPLEDLKIITAHLGNGASMAAIDGGVSVDTTMGFTPLEGLVMGTRCGDIDPSIIPFLQKKMEINAQEVEEILNKESGLLGISGISYDARDIEQAAAEGNERAQLAVDISCYRLKKFIGAYSTVMGRVDAIVFTAGIGEKSHIVRGGALAGLDFWGVKIDPEKNERGGEFVDIAAEDSKVRIFIIPTNEELVIARDTNELVKNGEEPGKNDNDNSVLRDYKKTS